MVAGGAWPSLRAAQPRRLPQSTPKGALFLSFFSCSGTGVRSACSPRPQALWPRLQAAADALGVRLGSPAAAPCGAECLEPDPFQWWDRFFAL